jgi:flagellar biosynthetic protein FliR
VRISGFVMAAPVLGTRALPMRARMILVLAITSVVAPVVTPATHIEPLSAAGLLTVVQQVIVGATIGMVLRLTFMVFEFAGQFVAQQTGLGFAAMVDPTSGSQVPVLAHLYVILATLIFFVSDAHLVLIKLLAESFTLLPVGPHGPHQRRRGPGRGMERDAVRQRACCCRCRWSLRCWPSISRSA